MPLPSENKIGEISVSKEKKTEKQFKKRGFKSVKLDVDKSGRRPDYFFYKDDVGIIVEVKTVFSADRVECGRAVSTYEERGVGKFVFYSPDNKLKDILQNSDEQYRSLINDENKYDKYPFVVAIFDESHFLMPNEILKDDFFGFNNISAVILPEINRNRLATIKRIPRQVIEILNGKIKGIIGPFTFEWRIVINNKAEKRVTADLFYPSIEN